MKRLLLSLVTLALPLLAHAETIPLSSLDLSLMSSGWGKPLAGKAVTNRPMRIGDQTYTDGVGTHADSEFLIDLGGRGERFTAVVGVDAGATNKNLALVEFIIYGDEKELWRSGPCRPSDAPKPVDVSLKGVRILNLTVTDGGNGADSDHANWANARITFSGAAPKAIPAPPIPPEEKIILTPPPPAEPRLNNPRVYGARPGSPFLYRIPATGQRPMTFAAESLPQGLTLDASTGIITGKLAATGASNVTLIARNAQGESRRPFKIVAGDQLALTPPMGWNSWYIHYHRISDKDMRAAADAMIASGMADFGYTYVNIDDCWARRPGKKDGGEAEPTRDANGRIRPNDRFPDMKALADYIHSRGLKAGIYTSPGPKTCAGYEGAWQHEAIDAATFADWGFDFLKYDWCSYGQVAGGKDLASMKRPYEVLWAEIKKQPRDIVVNLCQYGMGEVWKWGGEVGHCWRTTGDLGLEGGQLSKGIYKVGLFNATLAQYAGPGKWNDPDYLLIGWVGDAHTGGEGKPTSLTPNEQYTHMTMWSLMAAPLVFSGDMTRLDAFTLGILCNAEVIEIDQDPLGKQARIAHQTGNELILIKDLEDGSKAVGLFNLGTRPTTLAADAKLAGLPAISRARDVWRQRDIDTNRLVFEIPRHGTVMLRLWP